LLDQLKIKIVEKKALQRSSPREVRLYVLMSRCYCGIFFFYHSIELDAVDRDGALDVQGGRQLLVGRHGRMQ
jgi:hypothetical protein